MKAKTNTTVHNTVTVSGIDIFNLLIQAGMIPRDVEKQNITVVFKVPGGGDYSNTSVDFIREELVEISWTNQSMVTDAVISK